MENKYLKDLNEIKNIMNRSTRFISLSGLSGISAGVVGLASALYTNYQFTPNIGVLNYDRLALSYDQLLHLLAIGILTLLVAVLSALYFTYQNISNPNDFKWDARSKLLIGSLTLPLLAGGILIALLIKQGFIGFIPSFTLIFYGLALVNASKYTLDEIRSLGMVMVVLGIAAFELIEYSLFIWALGFGVSQIIYGVLIQIRYKK